jgi:hypothetical protein
VSKLRLIGLVMAAFFVALIGTAQGPPPQLITLPGISVAELECFNLKLLLPDGDPNVSAERAREVAEAADPFDLPVQQTVLARLVREGPPELVYRDNLVWVVVLSDGAVHQWNGPGGSGLPNDSVKRPMSFTYDLVLVDAMTGEVALGMFGPASPEYVANNCPS